MVKTLVIITAALFCFGCGRADLSGPDEVRTYVQVPGTVIDSFGEEPCRLTGANVVRVGWYYDFTPYDSLWISFDVTRLSTERAYDDVIVRIGPATSLRDTIFVAQGTVSLGVKVSQISKPGSCALTFRTSDPQSVLSLSKLRVVGWAAQPGD